jgi:hypothetical protein
MSLSARVGTGHGAVASLSMGRVRVNARGVICLAMAPAGVATSQPTLDLDHMYLFTVSTVL